MLYFGTVKFAFRASLKTNEFALGFVDVFRFDKHDFYFQVYLMLKFCL